MVNGEWREFEVASPIRSYKDLDVWSAAMSFAAEIYTTTREYPKEEVYGLTQQMRRASISIASNIAEGYGRETTAYFIQFLRIAQGSSKELETQIMISERIGLLDEQAARELMGRSDEVGRMLRGLIRSLETKER